MRNKKIISITLIICLAITAYFYNQSQNSTIRTDRRDFSIADTSQVSLIRITSKAPEIVLLTRIDIQNWSVNEKYKANKSAMYYLLKTLSRMEIAYPVPLSLRDNVIGNLAVKGLKVDVRMKDGSGKTFYVGSENKELTASYMMLKNASEPYAIHIPGFRGYLSSRFFTNEYLWRDKKIMNYETQAITAIKMKYSTEDHKNESFKIHFNDDSYRLTSMLTNEELSSNPMKVNAYKTSFQKLYAEAFVMLPLNKDSLRSSEPIFNLTVETAKEKTSLKVFHKKAHTERSASEQTIYDPERLYAYVNDNDWMIIQKNTFENVIKSLEDFK